MASTSGSDYKKSLVQTLNSYYSKLHKILEGSLEDLGREMFEAGLVPRPLCNYDELLSEFLAGMDLKTTAYEIQEHCRSFTNCLERLGGGAALAADNLVREWHLEEATPATLEVACQQQLALQQQYADTVQEEILREHSVELCALLLVDETRESLSSNLVTAGILSAHLQTPEQGGTNAKLLVQKIQAVLFHSPYLFTDLLTEMDKEQSLREIVAKMTKSFMSSVSTCTSTTSSSSAQQKQFIVDSRKMKTVLEEAESDVHVHVVEKFEVLKLKFNLLYLNAKSAIQSVDPEKIKFYVCSLLSESKDLTIAYFEEIANPKLPIGSSTLLFFQEKGLLNVWNYEILKLFICRLMKNDKSLVALMEEYCKVYESFFSENLELLQTVFIQENIRCPQPKVPVGLQEFHFKLNDLWAKRSAEQWRKNYTNRFSWSRYTVIKNIIPGSITIVYAALPCVAAAVRRDLSDPFLVAELKSIGVTVLLPHVKRFPKLSSFKFLSSVPASTYMGKSYKHAMYMYIQSRNMKEEVIKMCEQGVETNRIRGLNNTLLHFIAKYDCTKIGEIFRASLNIREKLSSTAATALYIATDKKDAELVNLISNASASCILQVDKQAFHVACRQEYSELILEKKTDLNRMDERKKSPLDIAEIYMYRPMRSMDNRQCDAMLRPSDKASTICISHHNVTEIQSSQSEEETLLSSVIEPSVACVRNQNTMEFEGAHVAGEKKFSIKGGSAQMLNWEEYGLRMAIPQGASDTSEVAISALVGGQFILPEDTELVSAVYHISVSKPFLEPVQLAIQHCVSIETVDHTSYLSFATAPVDQSVPYKFQFEDRGQFSPGEQFGTILLPQFSLWTIIKKLFRRPQATSDEALDDNPPVKLYAGQMIYEVRIPGRQWLMHFLLSEDLNALLRSIENSYENVEKDVAVHLKFEEFNGSLELLIDSDQESSYNGWIIAPHTKPLKISQYTVDSLSPPNFPSCLITIIFTPGDNTVPVLQYAIPLRGVKTDNPVLNIIRQSTVCPPLSETTGKTADEFRKHINELSETLGASHNFKRAINGFLTKKLITLAMVNDVTSISGYTAYDRASKVVHELYGQILSSQTPRDVLNAICAVLVSQEDDKLKEIGHKLSPSE